MVVDEVEPAEAHAPAVPTLVGAVVDDGRHASHDLAVAQGKVALGVAELERGILVLAEILHLVGIEVGHIVGIVLVKVVMEFDESVEFATRLHLLNFYC